MAKEIRVVAANPAGNITILVLDEVNQGDRVTVANRLLGYPEWKAEQVGFVVPAQQGGEGRLEMMGGEFCGNATRSFGYYLAVQKKMRTGTVAVEVSGTAGLLTVSVDTKQHMAWTQMPVPYAIERLSGLDAGILPMVRMDGILHVIAEDIQPDTQTTEHILEYVRRAYAPEAAGIMYVHEKQMRPMVYVAATDTLVEENSCGSGSIAYAYYLARNQVTGVSREMFEQPGGCIETMIIKEAGEVRECRMGGVISISEPITVRA